MKTQCPKCVEQGKTGNHFSLRESNGERVGYCFRCGYKEGGAVEERTISGASTVLPLAVAADFLQSRGLEALIGTDTAGLYVTGIGSDVYLTFPLRDASGDIVKMKYRSLNEKTISQSPGGGQGAFFVTGSQADTLVITEGEFDALACSLAGFAAVSVPNGALTKDVPQFFADILEQLVPVYDHICIWQDSDEPGRKSASILANWLKFKNKRLLLAREHLYVKDANDALLLGGTELVKELVERGSTLYDVKEDAAFVFPSKLLDKVRDLITNTAALGESTGWEEVDELFKVRRGELSVVTGWPGSGKSEWLDALCVNLAKNSNWKIAMCSLENAPAEHSLKLAKKWDYSRVVSGELESLLKDITRNFVFLKFEEQPPTVEEIVRRVELFNKMVPEDRKLTGLVLDPYNELSRDKGKEESETDYVSRMLGELRRLARRENLHVWIVAHPQKTYDNSGKKPFKKFSFFDQQEQPRDEEPESVPDYASSAPPTLQQISGSAHWHNKADIGITVQRVHNSNKVKIHVRKVRQVLTGKPGCATLRYDSNRTTYL